MERKTNNDFSSFLIIEQHESSSPASLSDKGKCIIPLSDKEVKIYKDGADTAPLPSFFSSLFFLKNEYHGAVSAPSL